MNYSSDPDKVKLTFPQIIDKYDILDAKMSDLRDLSTLVIHKLEHRDQPTPEKTDANELTQQKESIIEAMNATHNSIYQKQEIVGNNLQILNDLL